MSVFPSSANNYQGKEEGKESPLEADVRKAIIQTDTASNSGVIKRPAAEDEEVQCLPLTSADTVVLLEHQQIKAEKASM